MILSLCNLYNLSLNELYSDYLNFYNKKDDISLISGYLSLNSEHRLIVENIISFLNKLENK